MSKILDGRVRASSLAAALSKKIQKSIPKDSPLSLVIFVCRPSDASQSYIAQKQTLAFRLGIQCNLVALPEDTKAAVKKIRATLSRKKPDGALLQLPLPKSLDAAALANVIPPQMDVDVLGSTSIGAVAQGAPIFTPPIVRSVLDLLAQTPMKIQGSHAVVVGAGPLVGKPAALAFMNAGATVTICQKYTKNLAAQIKRADIVLSGTGTANLIRGRMIKKGAVVLDAGFSRHGGRVVGDIHTASVLPRVSALSPVPGGIGPLTVYFLLANVFEARRAAQTAHY